LLSLLHLAATQNLTHSRAGTTHKPQVPLPVLPLAYLDLSAFVADADCRAGMYQVPPVSAAALAKAAADDAAAAEAAAADAAEAAAAAAATAAEANSDASLTDTEDEEDEDEAADGYDFISPQDQAAMGAVLRRRTGAADVGGRHDAQQQHHHYHSGSKNPNLDKWKK
jgi:hypothetical protein